jgi:hypothetical protein
VKPDAVEGIGPIGADVGHEPSTEYEAREAERNVDQEDPRQDA